MTLREFRDMPPEEAKQLNPLQLAHLGDSVWELMVCSRVAWQKCNVRNMHKEAIARVNAAAQALALANIEPLLTEAEALIVRRGRNAKPHHAAPRNQDPVDYAAATALEALMGYLYLTGQEARILELFVISQEESTCPR